MADIPSSLMLLQHMCSLPFYPPSLPSFPPINPAAGPISFHPPPFTLPPPGKSPQQQQQSRHSPVSSNGRGGVHQRSIVLTTSDKCMSFSSSLPSSLATGWSTNCRVLRLASWPAVVCCWSANHTQQHCLLLHTVASPSLPSFTLHLPGWHPTSSIPPSLADTTAMAGQLGLQACGTQNCSTNRNPPRHPKSAEAWQNPAPPPGGSSSPPRVHTGHPPMQHRQHRHQSCCIDGMLHTISHNCVMGAPHDNGAHTQQMCTCRILHCSAGLQAAHAADGARRCHPAL